MKKKLKTLDEIKLEQEKQELRYLKAERAKADPGSYLWHKHGRSIKSKLEQIERLEGIINGNS